MTVYDFFYPFTLEGALLGARPFLSFSYHKLIFSLTVLGISGVFFGITWYHEASILASDGFKLSKIASFVNLTIQFVFFIGMTFCGPKTELAFEDVLARIHGIDSSLKTFGVHYVYDRSSGWKKVMLPAFVKLGLFFFHQLLNEGPILTYDLLSTCLRYYFIFGIFHAQNSLVAVLSLLNFHIKMVNSMVQFRPHSPIRLFPELKLVAFLISRNFSFQFFLLTTYLFICSLINICLIITSVTLLVDQSDSSFAQDLIFYAIWQVIRSYELWDLVSNCTNIENSMKELTETIIVRTVKWKSIAEMELVEIILCDREQLQFTGSGLFKVDNSLVHSMLSAATSYIVILLQSTKGAE